MADATGPPKNDRPRPGRARTGAAHRRDPIAACAFALCRDALSLRAAPVRGAADVRQDGAPEAWWCTDGVVSGDGFFPERPTGGLRLCAPPGANMCAGP